MAEFCNKTDLSAKMFKQTAVMQNVNILTLLFAFCILYLCLYFIKSGVYDNILKYIRFAFTAYPGEINILNPTNFP